MGTKTVARGTTCNEGQSLTLNIKQAPSHFFLFPKLKKNLKWTHFSSIEEVKKATTTCVHSNDGKLYRRGLEG